MTELARQGSLQRMRAAGLRPTIPRLAVLQVFEDAADAALSVEDVFLRLFQRGVQANLATAYRVSRELEQHGLLLRLIAQGRRQLYRLNVPMGDVGHLWAVNCSSGERAVLRDAKLQARLLAALADSGLALDGGRIAVEFCYATAQPTAALSLEIHHKRPRRGVCTN